MSLQHAARASTVIWLIATLTSGLAWSQSPQRQTPQLQSPPPNPATAHAAAPIRVSSIAVVDLVKVFDQHPFFKANLAATQQRVREFELHLSEQKAEITRGSRQLNELETDSAQYRQLESELARRVANLRVWTRQRQAQLTREKAEHYYAAYQDIVGAIAHVAQRRQIGLVLRVSVATHVPIDVPSLARRINQPVILQENLDITQLVINELRTATTLQGPPSSSRHESQPLR